VRAASSCLRVASWIATFQAMKNLRVLAIAVVALPRLAWGLDTSGLTTKAKTAFADITKAKTALNAGKTKTSDSWLAKSEGLLKSVLDKAPGGAALQKLNSGSGAATDSNGEQSPSALSQAEGEAMKLNPSLAGRMGLSQPNAAQADAGTEPADAGMAPANVTEAKNDGSQTSGGLSGLLSTYQKVTMARSLLKGGDSTKAKGVLDQIPSSPGNMLKGLSGL
jgi:hypothetical protein